MCTFFIISPFSVNCKSFLSFLMPCHLLKKRGLLSDLSVELFEKIISYTIIDRNGTVSIVLKNGNRIERTEEYDNGYGIRRKNSNGYSDKT